MNRSNNISASSLFRPNRFDLPIKKIYANYRERKIESSFGTDIYKEHLRLWNGFKEYNRPEKNSWASFKKEFDHILDSIRDNGFDKNISEIVIDSENRLLNGSHRTVACAQYGIEGSFKLGLNIRDGQRDCGFEMFEKLGLGRDYMDASALEMAKTNKDLYIVSLFPSAVGKDEEVEEILNKKGEIAYKRTVDLNKNGAVNYMRHCYDGEEWVGNWQNNFYGFRLKASMCFKEPGPMRVYLVEFADIKTVIKTKELIRDIYKISKNSVHINDTHEETIKLSRAVFNKNSIHFMNNAKLKKYDNFIEQLSYFKKYINDNNLDVEDYCVTASSILSIYGLREGNDLDYLHKGEEIKGHPMIHSHNEYGIGKYHTNTDNILYNPLNHFYFNDIKFSSIETVVKLKLKRKENKDIIDLGLIKCIL